jgi:uncharacterized protein (TIRG00374 family)
MTVASPPRISRRILLFVGAGLATLILYLYYFIGTAKVSAVVEKTNLPIYAMAFLAFLASATFYSLAWQSFLHKLNMKAGIREALLFGWAGMFFDAVVPDPGWSGDLSKAYMLSKASSQEPGIIVASVVSQKIIVAAVTVVSLILGLAIYGLHYPLASNILVFVVVVLTLTAFSFFVIVYLSASQKATARMLNWIIRAACFIRRGRWNPQTFRLQAEQVLNRFHEGIRTLSANPRALARPILFSLLAWGFDISITFLTFASLGYAVPADKVLIVYAFTGSLQAFGVSFLGFTEIIVSSSYAVLGISPAISVSATLLVRIVTLWFKLIISYIFLQWAGVSLLLRKGRETEKTRLQSDEHCRG